MIIHFTSGFLNCSSFFKHTIPRIWAVYCLERTCFSKMFFKEASFKLLPTAIKLLMLTYSFFHFMISFKQSELMCSSILLKGSSTPQRSWQGTILNSHFSALWELSSLRSIMPQVSLLEHFTCWKFHLFKCLMRSPFLITFVHFSLMHLMLNSFTSLRIGILGIISFLLKLLLHNGHS